MRRGWTIPHKYLSEKRQRQMLIDAGIKERGEATPIYSGGGEGWFNFVRALRLGDEAMVADLRLFGSRKRLAEAATQVETKGATLVVAPRDVRIHPPTLREAQRTESLWAGERSMGGSKRARAMSIKGNAERRRKAEAARMSRIEAEAIWRDLEKYPLRREALAAMPGWSFMMAYRAFGARDPLDR
jgi:hypothetical protein